MSIDNTPADVEPVTEADVASFAQKLQTWGESLPLHERAVLNILLSRTSDSGEVQGYTFNPMMFSAANVTMQVSPIIRSGVGVSGYAGSWLNAGWQRSSGLQGMPGMRAT